MIVAADDGRTLAEALVPDGPASEREVVLPFESDGETRFRVAFRAEAREAGAVRLVGLALRARRWPGEPPGAVRSRLFGPSPRASH